MMRLPFFQARDRLRYMRHAAVSDRKGHGPDTGGLISLSKERKGVFFCVSVGEWLRGGKSGDFLLLGIRDKGAMRLPGIIDCYARLLAIAIYDVGHSTKGALVTVENFFNTK